MPEPPRIKRYALVPESRDGDLRRFHLARVTSLSRSTSTPDRLERMEEIAERERREAEVRLALAPEPGAGGP